MSEPTIFFTFEGKQYETSMDAYRTNTIVLPDGRVLQANGWMESYPPQPDGLHLVGGTPAVEYIAPKMTKAQASAKVSTETVHLIDAQAIEEIVEAVYGQQFEITADLELRANNEHRRYNIEKFENVAQDKRITRFMEDGGVGGLTQPLLQDLVNQGYLPAGKFIVDLGW